MPVIILFLFSFLSLSFFSAGKYVRSQANWILESLLALSIDMILSRFHAKLSFLFRTKHCTNVLKIQFDYRLIIHFLFSMFPVKLVQKICHLDYSSLRLSSLLLFLLLLQFDLVSSKYWFYFVCSYLLFDARTNFIMYPNRK